jgi:hypothetical protein
MCTIVASAMMRPAVALLVVRDHDVGGQVSVLRGAAAGRGGHDEAVRQLDGADLQGLKQGHGDFGGF